MRAKALVLMRSVSFSRWLGKAAEVWRWVLIFGTFECFLLVGDSTKFAFGG